MRWVASFLICLPSLQDAPLDPRGFAYGFCLPVHGVKRGLGAGLRLRPELREGIGEPTHKAEGGRMKAENSSLILHNSSFQTTAWLPNCPGIHFFFPAHGLAGRGLTPRSQPSRPPLIMSIMPPVPKIPGTQAGPVSSAFT